MNESHTSQAAKICLPTAVYNILLLGFYLTSTTIHLSAG